MGDLKSMIFCFSLPLFIKPLTRHVTSYTNTMKGRNEIPRHRIGKENNIKRMTLLKQKDTKIGKHLLWEVVKTIRTNSDIGVYAKLWQRLMISKKGN